MTKQTTERIVKLEAENAALRKIATDFHWMARRYADGRSTYIARMFNENTRAMLRMGVEVNPTADAIIWVRDEMGRRFDGLSDEEATPGTEAALGITGEKCEKQPQPA